MKILESREQLVAFITTSTSNVGALADTGFLYALAYDDDRLSEQANALHETLTELEVPLYINVISRIEFADLIFRKQVTSGCLEIFERLDRRGGTASAFTLLKDIRDKTTAARRQKQSFKIDERRLKLLRTSIEQIAGIGSWKTFCQKYIGSMLTSEWSLLEEELGLNFIEVLENGKSDLMNEPLLWKDMVRKMGDHGMRGPDAMILHLFEKSRLQVLITNDRDFEKCLSDSPSFISEKALMLLN